ncbi:MAG: TolC family protein [Gemmatimonadota bacterium]
MTAAALSAAMLTAAAVGVLAFVLMTRSVAAENLPQEVRMLTLEEALALARESNPAYRQARNALSLNEAERKATLFDQVLPKPQLNLFQTQFTGNLTRVAVDNFGNPIERPTTEWNYFSQTNQSLDLTWRVQGASIFNALSRQKLDNRDRDLAEREALSATEIAVRRAYMNALKERSLLRAEEQLLEARSLDREVADRLFTLALRTRVDVLNAELAEDQQELAMRRQAAAYARAKLALRTAMGAEDLEKFELAEEALPVFDPSGLDADALVRTAMERNPRVRRAGVAADVAGVNLKSAKQAWWPTVFMNFSVARRAQDLQDRALFDVSFNEDLDQRFYLGLQIPMFNNYFQNRVAIRRSAVELDNAREAERQLRLEIRESVQGLLLELGHQYESLRLRERAGEIAAEALELAREEYRLGSRSFEDLRASFVQEADARREVIQARHAFVDALLSLEEAVGARVRPRQPR